MANCHYNRNGAGYRLIPQFLNDPVSTIINRKWKNQHSTINDCWLGSKKISQKSSTRSKDHSKKSYRRIWKKQVQLSQWRKKKTIDNALHRHSFHTQLPRKTPLLKKRHVEACLKFATQHLEKPVDYWKNVVWSDETQMEIFSNNTRCHVWRRNGSAYDPKYTYSEVQRWKHYGTGLFLFSWYWQNLNCWREDE